MIAIAIILAALLGLLLLQKSGLFKARTNWRKCPHCACYWELYPGPSGGTLVLIPGHVPTGAEDAPTAKCPNCKKEEQDHAC